MDAAIMEIVAQPASLTVSPPLQSELPQESEVLGIETSRPDFQIGDVNDDGCVNLADLQVLISLYGKEVVEGMLGDLDGDGKVGMSDIGVWVRNVKVECRQ
jgi:hypothetical protein